MDKPILMDDLVNTADHAQSQFTVDVDGDTFQGYQIAKPLNYDPDYFTMEEREKMAHLILDGKAIAVQYFEDLSEEQRVDYIKEKLG